ncbi:UDP-N-acetylmuramoyl-L-alanine--D-glutamate ligase [Sphingomonas sanxanigenens]|nr:UDP-N-acetylmuramoyl-L-alanine--D-glutamate ligase [Sphingomonas sanxanigenens]
MIASPAFRGKRYAVLGLARSGLATVRALLESGAEVVAWDSRAEAREAVLSSPSPLRGEGQSRLASEPADSPLSLSSLRDDGPSPRRGEGLVLADPMAIDLGGFDGLVVSPGVPINRHPIAARAREAGVPLIGDIELFAQARAALPPHRVVGITGTNGKSTTTALVHHICETAGLPALMGGNIGVPILSRDPLQPNPKGSGVYVLELSSYQIDLTTSLDCDVAVLLNITPDHLDRYLDFADYAASKARLFQLQSKASVAVIATEDDPSRAIAAHVNHRLVRVASTEITDQSRWPSLQGPHNAQNAAAAIAVARALNIADAVIEAALETYPGLPHRMERVAERDGVLFVNDSKATNPTSTAPALAAYPAVHWILGGQAKTDELDACAPWFGHVRAAYTIGEAGTLFQKLLGPHMKVEDCEMLCEAVKRAAAAAAPGETVLLSPACASFDQFRDYEARGDAFRAAVGALK